MSERKDPLMRLKERPPLAPLPLKTPQSQENTTKSKLTISLSTPRAKQLRKLAIDLSMGRDNLVEVILTYMMDNPELLEQVVKNSHGVS